MNVFQGYTSLKESKKLKALGVPQTCYPGQPYYDVWERPQIWCGHMLDTTTGEALDIIGARAYTFQEMWYELVLAYGACLSLDPCNDKDGNMLTHVAIYPDGTDDFAVFDSKGLDPFPAVYAAYCWYLKQPSPKNPPA